MAITPLVDFSLSATWSSLYSIGSASSSIAFVRAGRSRYLGNDHMALLSALGIKAGQHVVLAGGAYGWVAEDWNAAGLICAVVDNSSFIQSTLGPNATVPILSNDITANNTPAAIKKALGTSPDWVVTEDLLPCYSDVDAQTIALACRSLAPNVAHWVTCKGQGSGQDSRLNWHTAAEWKVLVIPDLVVQRGQATVA